MQHQYRSPSAKKIIDLALGEVGYREGREDGTWTNEQKYSPAVPSLKWSQFQAWCATFISWLALKAGFGRLYPCTASTDTGARWFKARGQWSEYPAIGGQGFLGRNGDMFHTFLVIDFDDTWIWTVEGNTNTDGSPQGNGVYQLKRRRTLDTIEGYGLPQFPEGIVSADPARAARNPKPPKEPIVATPQSTPWTRTRKRLTDAINHPDAKKIPITRPRVRAFLRTIRVGLAATPKNK
ncbi:hypothetical protein EFK50_00990 [Nocardioides marmoriginsengisoli]|uniref:CHAP domain-containing protein n=1 Tax=Nocardioides marmoriginsengisoli TaxID=661483 RepID=A0A3N0CRW9_9ACTN|nr:hypothetical protein [Nocardioides marmoriginsengisoli]RNL66232.1 hypothetical protein EFK50_00990 [Nocardioides marmoriginsengisoli]